MDIGYSATSQVKVIRTKHKVTFRVKGSTAADLIAMLKQVPPDAFVDEVYDSIKEDYSFAEIEFQEEETEQ